MYLDILIAIPLIWGMFQGFKKGLIIELCTLMALILGIYGAAEFADLASEYLQEQFNTDSRVSLVLAFTLLFIGIIVAVYLFGKALEGAVKLVALGLVNKLFGLIFGGAKYALIVSGIFFVLEGFPISENLIPKAWKKESYLYGPISGIAPTIFPVLKENDWLDDIKRGIEDLREGIEN